MCDAFFNVSHDCGKRCFFDDRTKYEMFKLVCTVCQAQPDKDCSFCPEGSDSCHKLEWCPSTPGESIYVNPPNWTALFPNESPEDPSTIWNAYLQGLKEIALSTETLGGG